MSLCRILIADWFPVLLNIFHTLESTGYHLSIYICVDHYNLTNIVTVFITMIAFIEK